jgi:hypothetical protein
MALPSTCRLINLCIFFSGSSEETLLLATFRNLSYFMRCNGVSEVMLLLAIFRTTRFSHSSRASNEDML